MVLSVFFLLEFLFDLFLQVVKNISFYISITILLSLFSTIFLYYLILVFLYIGCLNTPKNSFWFSRFLSFYDQTILMTPSFERYLPQPVRAAVAVPIMAFAIVDAKWFEGFPANFAEVFWVHFLDVLTHMPQFPHPKIFPNFSCFRLSLSNNTLRGTPGFGPSPSSWMIITYTIADVPR